MDMARKTVRVVHREAGAVDVGALPLEVRVAKVLAKLVTLLHPDQLQPPYFRKEAFKDHLPTAGQELRPNQSKPNRFDPRLSNCSRRIPGNVI
jgi:hypothetical protein